LPSAPKFLFVGIRLRRQPRRSVLADREPCDLHDVDPLAYLRDVLIRVDTHPAWHIDELLPHC